MGVTLAAVTGRASLGAVAVTVAAAVAPGQRCVSGCGRTLPGTAAVAAAGASNGIAVVGCKGGCVVANSADSAALAATADVAVVVVAADAGAADGVGVVAARVVASNGLGGGGLKS